MDDHAQRKGHLQLGRGCHQPLKGKGCLRLPETQETGMKQRPPQPSEGTNSANDLTWYFCPLELQDKNFCYLSHPLGGISLQQPQETNMYPKQLFGTSPTLQASVFLPQITENNLFIATSVGFVRSKGTTANCIALCRHV